MYVLFEKVCVLNEYRWIGEGKGVLVKIRSMGEIVMMNFKICFLLLRVFKLIKMCLNLSFF